MGAGMLKGDLKQYWTWYQEKYLENHVRKAWKSVIVNVVEGLHEVSIPQEPHSQYLCYRMLAQVAEDLESQKELSLVHMVHQLKHKKGYIKVNCEDNLAIQMVFQICGWLTTLWDPILDVSQTHFTIQKADRAARRRSACHIPTVTQNRLSIDERGTPFYRLLTRFGTLLPKPQILLRESSRGGIEAGPEDISAKYLDFHSLHQDLNLKLEWTSTLNQHLEWDQRSNILYVYRYPSICRLMYREKPEEGTLCSQIYRDFSRAQLESGALPGLCDMLRSIDIDAYFAEILLSYNLLFGQSRRSRAHAKKFLLTRTGARPKFDLDDDVDDPLLFTLCTKKRKHPEIKALHRDLEAINFGDCIPIQEYPFLGERLLKLQRRSMSRHPHGWRRLWNDRRNIGNWFIIWSVMFFGTVTIILALGQDILQVLQIWPPHR